MKVNLIVIKTSKPENLKAQYEALGLAFEYHRHGKGPYHFSASISGLTFEIYPLPKSYEVADSTTRLGIQVNDLANTLNKVTDAGWQIISETNNTEWGLMAVIQDMDGRKVELSQMV